MIVYTTKCCALQIPVSLFDLCYNFKFSRVEILNSKPYLKYYVSGKHDKLDPLMTEFNCVNL